MKVYVKKDKVLKLLGEGKVYSRKELMLKEQDEPLVADATPNDEHVNGGGAGAEMAVNKTFAAHSAADAASMPMSSLGNNNTQKEPGDGTVIKTNQADLSRNKGLYSRMAQTMPGAELQVARGNVQLAHKDPRKVMDEMRANSVPFTKSELTEFLKSL